MYAKWLTLPPVTRCMCISSSCLCNPCNEISGSKYYFCICRISDFSEVVLVFGVYYCDEFALSSNR